MGKYTQDKRLIKVDTILGKDVLLLEGFTAEEGVSTPFLVSVDMLSEDASIDAKKMLRSAASVSIELATGGPRVIHGLIRRFVQLGRTDDKLTAYRAEIVPWLWFMSLSSECKIFQNMTVPDILEQVFKSHGSKDFQIKCTKTYPKRDYCVQYRESHLNFVSRLMEDEGIFYFFEHTKDKHVLTLADGNAAVKPCPGQNTARLAVQRGKWQNEDVVSAFEHEHGVQTGKVTLRDYDFLQPSLQLESSVSGDGKSELYDYPGNYTKPDDGDRYARIRLEEQEAWQQVARGASTCRAFTSGWRFDLKEHYRSDINQPYMLVHVHHSGRASGYRSGEADTNHYDNSFVVIPHNVPLRPLRTTRKPTVTGAQTAVVVGKSGEEIWVDSHGRVKVQFPWDREGKKNENSSCWVRVSSPWAGKNWGIIQIPRIGQEVIVDFIEGDPDRPIITGRVWNAEQTPPYSLPADQTQSGVKSRSSKGGGADNFNEIRLEDKKGSEQIVIHAEKDMQVKVENDRSEDIGNNETISIGKDRTETVGKNESITIGENRTESVAKDESVSIGANRSLSVSKDESINITGKRSDSVGKNEDVTVGDNRTHNVGKDDKLDVGKNLAITAGDSITLKTGDATISMKKNGDIQIKGKNITIQGSGKISIKADSDVNIKGSKVTNN